MWQRFTERSRRVVFFSQEEAGRLGENYVSTEHILLGMVRENDSVASIILQDRIGVSLGRIRSEIERQVARGDGRMGQDMQLTPRAKRVIDLAYDEARQLENNYIGTEHLLLGLIREEEGLAGRVLHYLGVTLERAREEVRKLQDSRADEAGAEATDAQPQGDWQQTTRGELMERLQSVMRSLLALDPSLAKLPAETLLRKLTGPEGEHETTGILAISVMKPEVGDLGTLKSEDERAAVEVAVDVPAFLRLRAVFDARDAYGYLALAEEKRFFLIPTGTSVKLLKIPPSDGAIPLPAEGRCPVRILEGEHAGRTGWIAAHQFDRSGPDAAPFPPPLPENGWEEGNSDKQTSV